MESAYREGKVGAIGVSNFHAEFYSSFVERCGIVPAVDQVESHVYHAQLGLKSILESKGTRMQSWGSFTEGRRRIFDDPVLNKIAKEHDVKASQVALRYLVQNGISVIPKTVNRDRMRLNLDVFSFSLTDDDMQLIASLDGGVSLFGWY